MKFNVKKSLSSFGKNTSTYVRAHSSEILAGVGVCGFIFTIYKSVKETPKAIKLIEERKKQLGLEKLSVEETVRTTWKCYAVPATTATLSTICVLGSVTVGNRSRAALATAYEITKTSLEEYRQKYKEVSANKPAIEAKTQEDIKLDNQTVRYIVADDSEIWFYDSFSGRRVKTTKNKIDAAVNEVNSKINNSWDGQCSLNEFYGLIGLEHIDLGYEFMWTDKIGKNLDIYLNDSIISQGVPCIKIEYNPMPESVYSDRY